MAKQALEGVKIADFTWVAAGPLTIKGLADHGAQVIHIESSTHIEAYRTGPVYKGKESGINHSVCFAGYNNNKYGITLNFDHPMGLEIAKRIVKWADIVADNFAPGVMKRRGLDYEELRKIKPDIIMISLSNQGQTGPHSSHPAFGFQLTALSGFVNITGWPDRAPAVPYGAYTDTIAPRFGAAALMAALDYRRRTGKGQYLDLSQYEAALHFLSPLLLDFEVNRRVARRMGNRCSYAAPHGVYPCCGEDRWCAIAVFSDEEWRSFCEVVGHPEWTKEAKFATLQSRKENEGDLDRLIAKWTSNFAAEEVMNRMQAVGVAAGVVETCEDMFRDPQLQYRHHFWQLEHREIGKYPCNGPAFRLSKTPAELYRAGPCLGQDNEYVYTKILGMPHKEFVELLAEGAFE